MSRSITIVVQKDGHFDIHEGERVANGLVWDEMLAEIARLTQSCGDWVNGRYMTDIDTVVDRIERRAYARRA